MVPFKEFKRLTYLVSKLCEPSLYSYFFFVTNVFVHNSQCVFLYIVNQVNLTMFFDTPVEFDLNVIII